MKLNRVALIDVSWVLRCAYHSQPADSGPSHAGEQTLASLSDWRNQFDHIICCCDSPPYWRKQVDQQYKSSRERDDVYAAVCRWTRERMVADGYSIAAAPTQEADDIIASLALQLRGKVNKTYIIGADKDASMCISDQPGHFVHMLAYRGKGEWEERDAEWVWKKFGVLPTQMALLQAIAGDGSDDIKGISGIGIKGAAKLINAHRDIAGMRIAAVKALEESQKDGAKPLSAGWQKFLAGSPDLPKWLELTQLKTDVPLDIEALLVRQPMRKLVEDRISPEDIENGDAWEPSAEELEEERKMLDPTEVISGPPSQSPEQSPATSTASASSVSVDSSAESVRSMRPSVSNVPASVAPSSDKPKPAEVTGEIVVRADLPWEMQLQPRTANEALQIAKVLFNSRLYSQFGSERGVFAILMLGRELGLGTSQALQGFFSVKDRPFASSALLRALVQRHPDCEYFVCTHADGESATFETRRRSWPQGMKSSYTYTWERAVESGLTTGSNANNWKTKRHEMIEKTAAAKLARRDYSDVTFGLHAESEID